MDEKKSGLLIVCLEKSAILLFLLLFCTACSSFQEEKPFVERLDMEQYSQDRYLLAVEYMEKGRYELARQQFAVASASAVSPELQQMAQDGYDKAGLIIKERR